MIATRKYKRTPEESWNQLCTRVATHVAQAEPQEKQVEYTAKFFQIINELVFIPGGRILANSGTKIGNLSNCYVLDIEDSRAGIYDTLTQAAEVFSQGGGLGYNFSKLREKDSPLSTGSKASGPLAFMKLFNDTGDLIQQNSRRAAQMAQLNVDHPDIFEFIRSKATLSQENKRLLDEFGHYTRTTQDIEYVTLKRLLLDNQYTYFNISVMLTDDFMRACEADLDWELVSPKDGEVIQTVKARDILDAMAQRAWESGDPGVGFYDRINQDNGVPYLGDINASNPCSEIFMLPGESCVLGALNLHKFYDKESNSVNLEFLEYAIRLATRFLDDVVEVSHTGIDFIDERTKGLRRIGLGIMGWADLLAELELPYDSQEARELGEYLSWFISFFSLLESYNLAEERGEFPLKDNDLFDYSFVQRIVNGKISSGIESFQDFKLRNVSTTTIAPTGSISLLAGVNSGLEPFFLLAYKRNITDGQGNIAKTSIIEVNPVLLRKLEEYGLSEDEIEEVKLVIMRTGSIQSLDFVPAKLKAVFKTAQELDWTEHINMQAAWQKYVTNAISKTINLSESATVEDIKGAFIYGWKSGLKGMTVYRDKSKVFQILETAK